MGTQVNPFDIFNSGKNAARSGYSKGKMQGEQLGDSLNDFGDRNPRIISAIGGMFFLVVGYLFLKYGKDIEGHEYAAPIFWGLSAFSWFRFYWLGRKKKK